MRKIIKRKFDSLSESQLKILKDFINFLHSLRVISDYHIISRRYHDTVTTYHRGGSALSVDSQWCSLYEVEEIVVVGGTDC